MGETESGVILLLTTVGANFDARALARSLVEQKLAACVNVIDRVTSVYRWEGKVLEEGEQLLIVKTSETVLPDLRTALLDRHPYDVPELVELQPSGVNAEYANWILESVMR